MSELISNEDCLSNDLIKKKVEATHTCTHIHRAYFGVGDPEKCVYLGPKL